MTDNISQVLLLTNKGAINNQNINSMLMVQAGEMKDNGIRENQRFRCCFLLKTPNH